MAERMVIRNTEEREDKDTGEVPEYLTARLGDDTYPIAVEVNDKTYPALSGMGTPEEIPAGLVTVAFPMDRRRPVPGG